MATVNNRKVSPPSGKDEDPKEQGFFNRPRAGGKTIWDWLNFLATLLIPLVVVGATIGFGWWQAHLSDVQQQFQRQQEQQSALDQQRAAILQTYIDNIQDLLLNHNLLKANPSDLSNQYNDVATLARARTLTALQGLDAERKGRLLTFIWEARLIGYIEENGKTIHPIINLSGADLTFASLSRAYLFGADLYNANLYNANLSTADLSTANLSTANLSFADLSRAYLYKTNLSEADLRGASLSGADLSEAFLTYADLKGAIVTKKQLDQVKSLVGTIMPDGTRHP